MIIIIVSQAEAAKG